MKIAYIPTSADHYLSPDTLFGQYHFKTA